MQVNSKNSPSVFFIGFVWPEITSTAASQNIVSYLRVFANAGYKVHFASAAQRSQFSTDLKKLNVRCHDIALNCDSFNQLISGIAPDIVVFDRFLTEEQFGWRVISAAPKALRIMDCEDLHFLRAARQQFYKNTGFQPDRAEYLNPDAILAPKHRHYLYNDLTCREMACVYRCDLILTLSAFEQKILISHFNVPESNVLLLPYLIEGQEFQQQADALRARKDFISIGNFRHAPNIDAVNVLVQYLWPTIHQAIPEAACHIYGAYLPPKIKHLHNPKKGLHVHGHVEDHFSVLNKARVLLAPIQFGAGVKGKIIDALSCGLPSITTPIGVEGIHFDHWPGSVVDKRETFIQSAINTYRSSDEEMLNMQQMMQHILMQNFDTQANTVRLLNSIDDAVNELDDKRSANFMQQLVSHHSLQTHQYMSQWIAAKNALAKATA